MTDWLLELPNWTIVIGLLGLAFASNELGFRVGRLHRGESEPSQKVSSAIKGAIYGLVALLLGFSFSITLSRHELRKQVVLDEANALGTCYLRAGILGPDAAAGIQQVLREFLVVRLACVAPGFPRSKTREAALEMDRLMNRLWQVVESEARQQPQRALASQIVPAANEVIDLDTTRAWAADNHLPGSVFFLLAACLMISCLLIGHSSGQADHRHVGLWLALNSLLLMVLFVVLDFDRPLRGLIRVDHAPLLELQASFEPTDSQS